MRSITRIILFALLFWAMGCVPVWPMPVDIPVPPVAPQPASRYGVVALLGPTQVDAVRDLGIGSIRISLDWIDRQAAADSPVDFSDLDAQLERADALGLDVLVTLAYSPSWAALCRQCAPDPDKWRDFVTSVLTRYKDRPKLTFGIWNEPNGDLFFRDDEQATRYIALARIALQVRDDVAPTARMAAPETAYHAVPPSTYFHSAMTELRNLLKPHDVVTVHWYRSPDAPPILSYMRHIASWAEDREIWLTEANGESTCDDMRQQRDIAHVLHAMDGNSVPQWTRTFIYVLHDGIACGMGLLQPDWTRRAAFDWYRDYITARTQP